MYFSACLRAFCCYDNTILIPLIYLSMLFPIISLLTLLGLQSIAQPAARLAVPAGVTR